MTDSRLFLCPEGVVAMEFSVVFVVELLLTSGVAETIKKGKLLSSVTTYGLCV
jgi:hypothetical protein